MEDALPFILPLTAALLYVVGALLVKRSGDFGVGVWRTAFVSSLVTPALTMLLLPLGGTFHGTIVDLRPGRHFLVAECYWVPPEGAPLGPMVLDVTCESKRDGCELHVRQDGYEPSPRWRRYYAVVSRGWQLSLMSLKRCAEKRAADSS